MSFIGDIVGGVGSLVSGLTSEAPKIQPGKGFARSISTPEYSLKKGVLTPSALATGSGGFTGIFNRLGAAGDSFMGMRSGLSDVRTKLGGFGTTLADLRAQVAPGMGRLTEARVKAIRDASAESIGDLRAQLGRRAVLGSSFGNDAETRTRLAYAQAEEKARAEATIEEIQTSVGIIQQEIANQGAILGLSQEERATIGSAVATYTAQAQVLSSQISTELQKLGLAGDFTNNLNSLLMGQAINQAQLDMAQQTINAANIQYGLSKTASGIAGLAFGSPGGLFSAGTTGLLNTPAGGSMFGMKL